MTKKKLKKFKKKISNVSKYDTLENDKKEIKKIKKKKNSNVSKYDTLVNYYVKSLTR
jgi:hypothetical protein